MSVAPTTRVAMVRPPRASVSSPIADLRAQPDEAAELVDQAQSGEKLTILGESNGWAYVQGEDLYLGWIDRRHIQEDPHPAHELLVARHNAPVRREPANGLASAHHANNDATTTTDAGSNF